MSRPLSKLGEFLEEGDAGGGIHDEKAAQVGVVLLASKITHCPQRIEHTGHDRLSAVECQR